MKTSLSAVPILCALWMTIVVSGPTYTTECDVKTMTMNAGYREHPTDCSKYIQCHRNRDGQFIGIVRDCSYGTYWNPNFLTCISAKGTVCIHDLCYKQPGEKRRKGQGNCRGYYECKGSWSIPRCCPLGQYFHESLVCVNNTVDITCKDPCFDTFPYSQRKEPFGTFLGIAFTQPGQDASASQVKSGNTGQGKSSAAKIVCDKTVIPEEPGMYMQTLHRGRRTLKRRCPSGTIFIQAVCNCLPIWDQYVIPELTRSVNNTTQPTICSPIIYLPFTLDDKDQSGNAYQIINHNVIVRDGKAFFDGHESGLTIPRFPSLGITNSMVIKVVYSSDHKSIPDNRSMTIFSNGGCNEAPSVYMYENRRQITGGISTLPDLGTANEASIQQRPPQPGQQSSINEVMYLFHGGEFTLRNGDSSQTISTEGNFNKKACPLSIGYRGEMPSFKGSINEFTIYMCQDV
ncbi:protein PIF-like [Mya arenaria]|uniref:protein PIF-like n=1 Tax=Mya arenaria TaxID=6604 RepID=UPI0022E20890|nr:protein PIF-like [Mya arenaria]XP_052817903.1 protein PIF-like [Mya arenaria]